MNPSDKFEELIEKKQINFAPAKLEDLTQWGRAIVQQMIITAGISWELGDVRIGNAVCLKLGDPWLQYLDVLDDSGQFLWCTNEHHDGVHPDAALAYLLSKTIPDLEAQCIVDDKTGLRRMVLNVRGLQLTVDDLRDLHPEVDPEELEPGPG